jgi:hypothetical protein
LEGHVTREPGRAGWRCRGRDEGRQGPQWRQSCLSPAELIRLFREEELTSQDLLEGFATLVYAFMGMLDEPLDLVPAVIRRLRRLQLVPDDVLPTMAGALTAAALRQSPLRWRRGLGAMAVSTHGSEALAWSYAAWLLADFLDFARGERELPPT